MPRAARHSAGLAEMYVGTIHGFCLELLKSEVPEVHEVRGAERGAAGPVRGSALEGVGADAERDRLDGKPLKRYTDTRHYVSALSILREDEAAEPSKLEGCSVLEHLATYEELLHEKGYLDYSGILEGGGGAARDATTGLRARLAARVKHVIVDEYQDVNPDPGGGGLELHELGANVCVVGDDDQTIYQWRGSDVQNILTFERAVPGRDAGPTGGELPVERGRRGGGAGVHPTGRATGCRRR